MTYTVGTLSAMVARYRDMLVLARDYISPFTDPIPLTHGEMAQQIDDLLNTLGSELVSPDYVERLAKIIDPEAFGLPNNIEKDTFTDRDEARDRARIILRELPKLTGAIR